MCSYCDYSVKDWMKHRANHNDLKDAEDRDTCEQNLVITGVFAMQDPLRPGIAKAVEQCHRSGINVRMCTGDYIDTAIAISKEASILTSADIKKLVD